MELYKQQQEALEAMVRFVESDESVFILKGYAGTGKTTLIKTFCQEAGVKGKTMLLMAPTGRAAKMLTEKTGFRASTIHQAIYRHDVSYLKCHDEEGNPILVGGLSDAAAKDDGSDDVDLYFDIKKLEDKVDAKSCVIVVDEASMISSRMVKGEMLHFGTDVLLDDLLTFAHLSFGTKIVFVGDPAQLPPVGDNESKALCEEFFRNLGYATQSYTLSEVVRQKADSMILANAMKIRQLLVETKRNELVFDMREGEVMELGSDEVVDKYLETFPHPALGQGVVVCYSNAMVMNYNKAIRSHYFDNDTLHCGDVLQVVRNNSNPQNGNPAVFNGDFICVISEPGAEEIHRVPVWVSEEGKRRKEIVELHFQDISYQTDGGVYGHSKLLTNLLHSPFHALTRVEFVAVYVDFLMRYPKLKRGSKDYFDALADDPYFNAVHAKFGYAITAHKAQGGEWPVVFVDYSHRTGLDTDSLRWSYTATTRASECLYGVNMPKVSPFGKFVIGGIRKASKIDGTLMKVKDSECSLLGEASGATPAQKAKCNSAMVALAEMGCRLVAVKQLQYNDRYTIEGPFGQREYNCIYDGAGVYKKFTPLRPSTDDELIIAALSDERAYEYDYSYTPSSEVLGRLHHAVVSATDELGVQITGVKECATSYNVAYGFKTTARSAILFYYDKNGAVTSAMPSSTVGADDSKLDLLINRIKELTCQQ